MGLTALSCREKNQCFSLRFVSSRAQQTVLFRADWNWKNIEPSINRPSQGKLKIFKPANTVAPQLCSLRIVCRGWCWLLRTYWWFVAIDRSMSSCPLGGRVFFWDCGSLTLLKLMRSNARKSMSVSWRLGVSRLFVAIDCSMSSWPLGAVCSFGTVSLSLS